MGIDRDGCYGGAGSASRRIEMGMILGEQVWFLERWSER
jgi:hypothetical protein